VEITTTDVAIFIGGIIAGIVFGYCFGKIIFNQFFKRQEKAITIENVGKFTAIQQGLNYLLGFALGSAALTPLMGLIMLLAWLGFQTFLAMRIFGFRNPIHGLTYAFIDTGADLTVGTVSGVGAATFTLFRLALMAL
jgi:small-conductance mechanosensitive channel